MRYVAIACSRKEIRGLGKVWLRDFGRLELLGHRFLPGVELAPGQWNGAGEGARESLFGAGSWPAPIARGHL